MGGFRLAQMGFRSPWAGEGPLVLVGGRGFAHHGPPRVLGLVVVAENGSDLVLFLFILFYFILLFGFVGMDLAVVDVDGGSGGGSGGEWFGFWIGIWILFGCFEF